MPSRTRQVVRIVVTLLGCGLLFIGLTGGSSCTGRDQPTCVGCEGSLPSKKVIIVLIDGLRFGRLNPSGNFKNCRRLLEEGKGHLSVSVARPPTVTLPRIKTIASGRSAVYSDVLFNFFGESTTSDNIISRLRSQNKTVTVNGDDTWHRTFGVAGDRVTSFNVTDFTEVDYNVSRHLSELVDTPSESHADLTILHYLGVDHIGHYLGSNNPQMDAKERQMDEVLNKLATSTNTKQSLIWVLSDHGMTMHGNHGGSSQDEIETVSMVLSQETAPQDGQPLSAYPSRNAATIQQIDIAVTLSLLLQVPIPRCSNGVLWPVLFSAKTLQKCLLCNSAQLQSCSSVPFSDTMTKTNATLSFMFSTLSEVSDQLNNSSLSTNPYFVVLGFLALMLVVGSLFPSWGLIARSVVLCLPLWSSTYSEEYHVVYSYISTTVLIISILASRRDVTASLVCVLMLRIGQSWGRSGIWSNETVSFRSLSDMVGVTDSISSSLLSVAVLAPSVVYCLLSRGSLFVFSMMMIPLSAIYINTQLFLQGCCYVTAVIAYMSTLDSNKIDLVILATHTASVFWLLVSYSFASRWAAILLALVSMVMSSRKRLNRSFSLSMYTLLMGVVPVVDIPAITVSFILGGWLVTSDTEVVTLCTLAAFSFPGRSISIANFTLSSAYELVGGYNPVVLPILILLTRYAGLLCCVAPHLGPGSCVPRTLYVVLLVRVLVASVVAVFMNLEGHLFIWSVFTPSLMFSCADVLLGSLLCLF